MTTEELIEYLKSQLSVDSEPMVALPRATVERCLVTAQCLLESHRVEHALHDLEIEVTGGYCVGRGRTFLDVINDIRQSVKNDYTLREKP